MIFIYWDNRNGYHSKKILEVSGFSSILDADIYFQDETGFNPIKCMWIGCQPIKK